MNESQQASTSRINLRHFEINSNEIIFGMEVQNYKLYQREGKLREMEEKEESFISILRREGDKIALNPESKLCPHQKLSRRKQVEANYTLKLPKSESKRSKIELGEEKITEKKQLRIKMIAAGNSFSKKNKSLLAPVELPKQKTSLESKQNLLTKAKELGNRYSKTLNRRDKFHRNHLKVADLNRLRGLLAKKLEAENFYEVNRKLGQKVSDAFVAKYSKVVEEIMRLETFDESKNRFSYGNFNTK